MWEMNELMYESDADRRTRGTIELRGDYVAPPKAAWFVILKLAIISVVITFVYMLVLRQVPMEPLKLTALYFGVILIYCGLSYFIRPRANDTNLGMFGGFVDDPTQYSDDINRSLLNMEMFLQPGLVVVEAVLDFCNLIGLHAASEEVSPVDEASVPLPRDERLKPNRFE